MRAIIVLLLSGLSLISIAACAPISGDVYSKAALASTCPALEGYPDCHPGQDGGQIASSQR